MIQWKAALLTWVCTSTVAVFGGAMEQPLSWLLMGLLAGLLYETFKHEPQRDL